MSARVWNLIGLAWVVFGVVPTVIWRDNTVFACVTAAPFLWFLVWFLSLHVRCAMHKRRTRNIAAKH